MDYITSNMMYCVETDRLLWTRNMSGRVRIFDEVGYLCKKSNRYIVRICKSTYFRSRIVWAVVHGIIGNDIVIDHINRDTSDDRLCNLRAVSINDNLKNRGRQRNNSSGVNGVYLCKIRGKYRARLSSGGKRIDLGYYDTIGAAKNAIQQNKELHGFTETHGLPDAPETPLAANIGRSIKL